MTYVYIDLLILLLKHSEFFHHELNFAGFFLPKHHFVEIGIFCDLAAHLSFLMQFLSFSPILIHTMLKQIFR